MKITVFTRNQPRHLCLLKKLSEFAEVYSIIECNTIFPGKVSDFYNNSDVMQKYFNNVLQSENHIFGKYRVLENDKQSLIVKLGDIKYLSLDYISNFLDSDYYIVFGSSYIKGELCDFLIKHKCINIHMGVSPYYRGSDCNFWAAYDKNFDMVGGTIHYLSNGLDSGDILYHSLVHPSIVSDVYDLGMLSVLSSISSLVNNIKDNKLCTYFPVKQDKKYQIRYSKYSDFTDKKVSNFMKKCIINEHIVNKINSSYSGNFINPYYYRYQGI